MLRYLYLILLLTLPMLAVADAQPLVERPDGPLNLAFVGNGAKPASEFPNSHMSAGKLNDGKYGGASTWSGSAPNSGFQIELAALAKIDRFKFGRDRIERVAYDRPTQSIKIETSTDGSAWKTVLPETRLTSVSGYHGMNTVEVQIAPVEAKYVRAIVQPAGACIDEFEIYGADSKPSTLPPDKLASLRCLVTPIDTAVLFPAIGPRSKDDPDTLILKPGQKIVAIGDSITQLGGYLVKANAVLAGQYPELKIPPIYNVGVSGQRAEDMLARFDHDVIAQRPAVVTINAGINDVETRLHSPHDDKVLAAYRRNVATMVDKAQAAGIVAILLAPTISQEDPASEGNRRLQWYVDAEREIAAEKHCRFVDLHALFFTALHHKPAGTKGPWLLCDIEHMGPLGNGLMAIAFLRALGVPDDKIATARWSSKPLEVNADK